MPLLAISFSLSSCALKTRKPWIVQTWPKPWICQGRFRTSIDSEPITGLRGLIKTKMSEGNPEAHLTFKDAFLNPIASIQFKKGRRKIISSNKDVIEKALSSLPTKNWSHWVSFIFGRPDAGDTILADGWNRPVEIQLGSVTGVCRYINSNSTYPTSCIITTPQHRIELDFTFMECS